MTDIRALLLDLIRGRTPLPAYSQIIASAGCILAGTITLLR